jgi:hypothetical protein
MAKGNGAVVASEDVFRAQNGLVLRLRKVSRLVIVDAGRQIKNPKVPVTIDEDKGREMENPLDPDYLQAVQDAEYERSMVVITTLFALGTDPIEIPEGLAPPEDEDWLGVLDMLQVKIPAGNKRLRYAAWLKYIALVGDEFNDLVQAVFRFSGMTMEADVKSAEDSFPDKEGTPGYTGGKNTPVIVGTDNNRSAARARAGVRGNGSMP